MSVQVWKDKYVESVLAIVGQALQWALYIILYDTKACGPSNGSLSESLPML